MSGTDQSPETSIARRAVRGAIYISAGNWATFVVNFAIGIVIAVMMR